MTAQSVLFFDIDGTLLDHNKELPNSTKEAIQQLKAKGHVVAIATGRGPFMYKRLREELGIDTYVSYNGQYVVVKGEVAYKNPLHRPSLEKLTNDALKNNHPVVYMSPTVMRSNVPEHAFITESISTLKMEMPSHDPLYYQDNDIFQTLLFCEEGEEKQYEEAFPAFDFVRWHPLSVDVLPKGGSKAQGIEQAMQKLQFAKEHQYAFGDGLNDIEMLESVTNSVAMGNAEEIVKSHAKYVTKPVDQDGIYHGLKMLGLL
ncbi:Cof-type HAD-IIB family hydrolase [Ornithinibacillus contaminans]|uniref:Cof-type HAD-IIB family hydrolase n=1 Tax=Ornithinibacillus contaminans TaxID=694055 RepID=UPI00064D8F91|nr:Cof-type HAD-IIB family hydrolase [Ornithinibacillus contaminans]